MIPSAKNASVTRNTGPANVKKPKGQNFAVISFAEAHPNYLEQAEVSTWATFMRQNWHKFSAGKRFKPRLADKIEGGFTFPPRDVNPNDPQDKKYVEKTSGEPEQPKKYIEQSAEMVKETVEAEIAEDLAKNTGDPESDIKYSDPTGIPACDIEEILEDYVLWKNCNVIKIGKYLKKYYPEMPTSRAIFIYGIYNTHEDAIPMRNMISRREKIDVFVVPIMETNKSGVVVPAAILFNPPKTCIKNQEYAEQYTQNLMENYYENQRDADELNDEIQQISIRMARDKNLKNKGILEEKMRSLNIGDSGKTAAEKMAEVERMKFATNTASFINAGKKQVNDEHEGYPGLPRQREHPESFLPVPTNSPIDDIP